MYLRTQRTVEVEATGSHGEGSHARVLPSLDDARVVLEAVEVILKLPKHAEADVAAVARLSVGGEAALEGDVLLLRTECGEREADNEDQECQEWPGDLGDEMTDPPHPAHGDSLIAAGWTSGSGWPE